MAPFWSLDFEVVSVFLENVYTPDYRQYGQTFLHSLRLTAAIFVKFIINTFAASYLNTQGLNNSCLKSPASTLLTYLLHGAEPLLKS